ncbi:MAG: helix-turn-helix domain-containing protein [Cenarchaeum sp. SB0661_bin_35]|nr:helix-turn-helix domain-containing protein [Cenarchaeum sp. SB0661_bin_35]MYC80150.1 helix-turn-helix domain-containing protein [Cenarchaeum sp. SB0661_bin_35]
MTGDAPAAQHDSKLAGQGRDRGLYGLADKKSPGRPPMICRRVDETIREWLSKSPGDFGFERKRWQLNMLQKKLRDIGIKCSDDTARRAMHRVRFFFRKSRPAPHKSASMEEQKNQGGKVNCTKKSCHTRICNNGT